MKGLNLAKTRRIVLLVFASLIIFGAGYGLGMSGFVTSLKEFPHVTIDRQTPLDKNLDFSLFWKVWDTLSAQYVDKSKIVSANMVYGAIKGMVASLGDPYTIFLTPDENKVTEDDLSGNFDGVGIQIGYQGETLAVVAPLPGSPADKAGVQAGDLIAEIVDKNKNLDASTQGMTLPQAVQIIRGTKGTTVSLTLIREGADKPIIVDLVRDTIEVPSVTLEFVGDNQKIAHVKISKFGAETKAEWDKAITQVIATPGVTKIILDLRNNPGGYLQAAVDIASDFLPKGSTVVSEQDGNGNKSPHLTQIDPRLTKYQTVLLVNKGSASASEILSGALRDDLGIKLIGVNTFGKGTVQEPLNLDNNSGLHITVAKWLTPSGDWIHEKGLVPDIEAKDDPNQEGDEQLQAALDAIK